MNDIIAVKVKKAYKSLIIDKLYFKVIEFVILRIKSQQ